MNFHYKNLILLDRNILSIIKEYNKNKLVDSGKLKLAQLLKDYDREENFISVIFTVIEGNKARKENEEEKARTLVSDSLALQEFFTYADYETKLIKSKIQNQIYGEHLCGTRNWEEEERFELFLTKISPIISQPISPSTRIQVIKKLCIIAREFYISLNNPLGFAVALTVFNDPDARKILKPKSTQSDSNDKWLYNVMSDLHSIRILYEFKNQLEGKFIDNIIFVTADKALDRFLARITFHKVQQKDSTISRRLIYQPIQFSFSFHGLALNNQECIELAYCLDYMRENT